MKSATGLESTTVPPQGTPNHVLLNFDVWHVLSDATKTETLLFCMPLGFCSHIVGSVSDQGLLTSSTDPGLSATDLSSGYQH